MSLRELNIAELLLVSGGEGGEGGGGDSAGTGNDGAGTGTESSSGGESDGYGFDTGFSLGKALRDAAIALGLERGIDAAWGAITNNVNNGTPPDPAAYDVMGNYTSIPSPAYSYEGGN